MAYSLYRFSTTPTLLDQIFETLLSQKQKHQYIIYLYIDHYDLDALYKTLSSLPMQSYPHWTLNVAYSDIISEQNINVIQGTIEDVLPRNRWKEITELDLLCDDTYILYLSPGDRIRPDCLYRVSEQIAKDGHQDLISFDVAVLTDDWQIRPWFRPSSTSPEMMISRNCLSHSVMNTGTLNKLITIYPALKKQYLVTDYGFLLKMAQNHSIRHIHISRILFYERVDRFSNPINSIQKEIIRNEYLQIGLRGIKFIENPLNEIHITWEYDREKVSIIIPSKNRAELISRCINSLQNITDYPDYEIIIIDNGSTDQEVLSFYQSLKSQSMIKVVQYNETFNYSHAINLGASYSTGKYLLFLNNDITIFEPDWLSEMVQWCMLPEIGVVGAKLLYPDNTIQHAGVVFDPERLISHVFCHQILGKIGPHGSENWYRNYLGVTGACQMIRRDLFNQVGGYDEEFKLVFSDIEICLRLIQKGYRVVFNPYSVCYHHESATRSDDNPAPDILRAFSVLRKELMEGDPYFSNQLYDSFNPHVRETEPDRNLQIKIRVNAQSKSLRKIH